jgi:hypothetical protein
MRKSLLASLLIAMVATSASATQFWYDVITNYPGGCITTNSGGLWWAHLPGVVTATDALIVTNSYTNTYTTGTALNGKRLRINGLNTEYIERWLDPTTGGITNTFSSGTLYASFIVNANFVPSGGVGTYFAAFNDGGVPFSATNGFEFRGRVSQIGNYNLYPFTNTVPLTYRFGVANANDDLPKAAGPNAYVPIDAVKNVDYQVVLKFNFDDATATLWVNPASESDTANKAGPTSDFGPVTNGFAALLFRQRTTGGTLDIRDIAVGTTFADVMTNVAATSPTLVATNYNTVTNYTGNPALLEVFATSFGGGALSYQWYQISGSTTNPVGGNSQTYFVPSLAGSDTGSYFCAVTNSGGQGALSVSSFYISVNTTPTAPTFTSKPAATVSATVGGKLTLSTAVSGTGPLSFVWSFNGTPLVDGAPVTGNAGDISVVSGSQTPILTISALSTNESGNFTLNVTGGVAPAASTSVAVTVSPARAVNIAYIRSLGDTSTWLVTDTTGIYTISNAVVTMFTNVTSGVTASYYIQDATGGLDMFVTGDATFRPNMGDLVSISGTLSSFNNSIELLVDTSNPYQFYTISGHTNVLPAPFVMPLSATNSAGLMETNIEGKIVMLTNVGFTASLTTPTGNGSLFVTNVGGGNGFQIFFPGGTDSDVRSKTLQSRFAYTITGVMAQFKSGAYNNASYELYVTRIGDIVTNPPPAVTVTESASGNNVVLNWTAVPYTPDTRGAYAYSVLAADDVAGPYLPLATGLAFNTTNGTYTDVSALLGTKKFYRISSP